MKTTRFLALLLSLTSPVFALEPWADDQLPIREGVELWLDAARQPAAREARKMPALTTTVDQWLDGSGRARDVAQSVAAAQPRWEQSAGGVLVRFDGKDDWLGATKLNAAFENVTVFVVAAPRLNSGGFRGFVSWTETARNDYVTGFNLDLGGAATATFSALSAEGAGFRGERNLLKTQFDFGTFHVFSVVNAAGANGLRLFLDGGAEGRRDRAPATSRMDELAIGARLLAKTNAAATAQSFLEGDLAEVLVYGRALSDAERAKVEAYLIAKHRVVKPAPLPGVKPLVTVKNPPPVQMLVPGFITRELPVALTNIDCLRYRADGKLVAGAYNGKIWLLSDTDGDGLEDKADLFWESPELKAVIGMALTPPGDPRGQGVFVATQGRILFIPDKDGDGRGDEERIVASGWEKQVVGGGGGIVDALGLAMGPDGDLFFGLGTSAYNNAYLLDKTTGAAGFSLGSERGTVQRVSADFSKRETICTGIRYPVGAAFNALGDLFMTEQEGATWLPNGNPFDELVFIERGRHYGFPPAHPKHLPGVIDEPSVFDYGPQHQSTCGFTFNGPQTFGPSWWAGDALVTGEARGKLWRTKLVKTPAGYVAQNQLIAALAMLAVDVAVSPRGELVVACHSGDPDWGTGPNGAGKIFKIALTDQTAPQPVLAWSASPTELRVAFDRELDFTKLKDLAKKVSLERGIYVAAADRFESFRPGYQAVKDQMAAPRFNVPVLAASLSADRRELALITAPQTAATNYALTLPGLAPTGIDLASDLTGVVAAWKSSDGAESWNGWLPHPDLAVARAFTAGSASHARLFELLAKPGQLRLRGQFDVYEMLQPAIQPGAKLDYERPIEKVTVRLRTKEYERVLTRAGRAGEWLAFDVAIKTGKGAPELTATWSTADDPRPRAFPLRRVLLPWAQAKAAPAKLLTEREIPEIKGGNWLAGRKLFYGKATCSVCHKSGAEGGIAGPDLSNLTQRDYASVVRDIREPSAALNPDRLAYLVEPKEGAAFVGALLGEENGQLQFADATGAIKRAPRAGLKSMEALSTSLMPPGLLEVLTPDEQRDLLTFLLMPPLEPAPLEAANPPPPRPRAEVTALLQGLGSDQLKIQNSKFKIVLCAGPKDHGRGEHDYPLWQKRWSRLLPMAEGVEVSTAWLWPSAEQWQSADVIAFFSNNPGWNPNRVAEYDAFLARGGGLAYFHFAVDGHEHAPLLAERIGLAIERSGCQYRHGAVEFTMHAHPLTAGLPPLQLVDETYWNLRGDESRLQLLASAIEDGAPRPQIWTREHGGGRVFVSVPGHYNWTFDDPLFRAIAFRGLCWAGRQPIDRLAELITVGARIGE